MVKLIEIILIIPIAILLTILQSGQIDLDNLFPIINDSKGTIYFYFDLLVNSLHPVYLILVDLID